jgi:hypothetical protein
MRTYVDKASFIIYLWSYRQQVLKYKLFIKLYRISNNKFFSFRTQRFTAQNNNKLIYMLFINISAFLNPFSKILK